MILFLAVYRLQHSHAGKADRPALLGSFDQAVHCRLPRFLLVLGFGQPGDVLAGLSQRAGHPAVRQFHGLVKGRILRHTQLHATEPGFKRRSGDWFREASPLAELKLVLLLAKEKPAFRRVSQ
jgi:hypothetical protein